MRNKIVTRMPPSPTGLFHIGSVRTALYNYLYAKQNDGKFILRIEDTDKERSKKEFEDDIVESLKWLKMPYEKFYRQSERTEIYKKYLKKLIEEKIAYVSKEEPKEEGERGEVIRFKNPNKKIKFNDLVLGDIEFDITDLKDFVIAKDLDTPLYHLAVVVDDMKMGVTHVIRGQDHISNTPRQILILEALGGERPKYAHVPLILGPDKSKLSKRHGATSVLEYRKIGYLPEALLNFVALIGWNPSNDKEIFTLKELLEEFSLEKVQKSGGIFNIKKLISIQKEHMKLLSPEKYLNIGINWVSDEYISKKGLEKTKEELLLIRDNVIVFSDIPNKLEEKKRHPVQIKFDTISNSTTSISNSEMPNDITGLKLNNTVVILNNNQKSTITEDTFSQFASRGELYYLSSNPEYNIELLIWKDFKNDLEKFKKTLKYLEEVFDLLKSVKDWKQKSIKDAIWNYAEKEGKGNVLWPMRVALSGEERSPDPFKLAKVLGKNITLKRIEIAINSLKTLLKDKVNSTNDTKITLSSKIIV